MEIANRYRATADAQAALTNAGTPSPFTIDVVFLGGLTQTQMDAFKGAADRWCRVIVGNLPSFELDGETIDDVRILAQGRPMNLVGGTLGSAGWTHLRPRAAGRFALLPAQGVMSLDVADLEIMESVGTLEDVVTHEMGHVLGIGTLWTLKSLLQGSGTATSTFIGPSAMAEYGLLLGSGPTPVPIENLGGAGTREKHWKETLFQRELMTGSANRSESPPNPPHNRLSRLTVASLQDLGYIVDMNAAEPYALPTLFGSATAFETDALAIHDRASGASVEDDAESTLLPEATLQL